MGCLQHSGSTRDECSLSPLQHRMEDTRAFPQMSTQTDFLCFSVMISQWSGTLIHILPHLYRGKWSCPFLLISTTLTNVFPPWTWTLIMIFNEMHNSVWWWMIWNVLLANGSNLKLRINPVLFFISHGAAFKENFINGYRSQLNVKCWIFILLCFTLNLRECF